MIGREISRNALLLSLFAVIATAAIAGTWLGTRDAIEQNMREAQAQALREIIPRERHDNSLVDDTVPVADRTLLGLRETGSIHVARQDGRVVAVIVPATARDGYTGDIDLIVGINVDDGRIAGVRVLSHRETPGLGDKVERAKSNWIDSFTNRSLENPSAEGWAVRRDGGEFDQFTGATITPRAVVGAVHRALRYFEANREAILAAAISAPEELDSDE